MSNDNKDVKVERGEPIIFFVGLIVLFGGIFLVFKNTMTYSGFGYGNIFGGWQPPAGLIIIPLLIGVIVLIATDKTVLGWLLIAIGILIILLGVLMSLKFSWRGVSLFDTIMMFGLVAVGAGLMLKGVYGKKK